MTTTNTVPATTTTTAATVPASTTTTAAAPRGAERPPFIAAVLGAADPEMATIEKLLAGRIPAFYATSNGKRVTPASAYKADGVVPSAALQDEPRKYSWGGIRKILLIECEIPVNLLPCPGEGVEVVRLDHHRPGDPGYGVPPEKFLYGASLGQLISWLAREWVMPNPPYGRTGPTALWRYKGLRGGYHPGGFVFIKDGLDWDQSKNDWIPWSGYVVVVPHDDYDKSIDFDPATDWTGQVVPPDMVMAAAADHCLAAAYAGLCPGVDPDALMEWRVTTRAAHQGRPAAEILAGLAAARKLLRDRFDPAKGFADLRGQDVPELPEAAARENIPFLATVRERDGRLKVVLQAAHGSLVTRFLEGGVVEGLTGLYGDPARGFAGGYVA